jgi:hypothetical protein
MLWHDVADAAAVEARRRACGGMGSRQLIAEERHVILEAGGEGLRRVEPRQLGVVRQPKSSGASLMRFSRSTTDSPRATSPSTVVVTPRPPAPRSRRWRAAR